VHLSVKAHWHPKRIIVFVLAGTLPIASFITERKAQNLFKNL